MNKVSWWIIAVAVFILVGVTCYYGKVYLNIFTTSLPQGIYLRKEGPAVLGEYALSCLTSDIAVVGLERKYLAQGTCPTGIIPVGKVIKGVPGDSYTVSNGRLFVHGEAFLIVDKDSEGRELKTALMPGKYVLSQGQYLLLSSYSNKSWDSRYWGPVPVQFLLKPLVVFYGKNK